MVRGALSGHAPSPQDCRATAPDPSKLGHPLFTDRLKDRRQRWLVEKQPNPYAAVASKTGGTDFMRAIGYSVPERYGIYPTLDDLPRFEDLPKAFALKPLNGFSSTGVFLMRDGVDLMRHRPLTRDQLIQLTRAETGRKALAINGAWVAEELLFNYDDPDTPAHDYKFLCFGPKVLAIVINKATGLKDPKYRVWLRDPDWQPLPYQIHWNRHSEPTLLPRPPCLDDMLHMASDAAGQLNIFVRVDLFATQRGPVFCEFTGYPHSGNNITPRADVWLGSHWKTLDGGVDP
ncbi:MAG: hypothetical protein HC783_06560 [Rhodobacteraceae bacterium]|nr:hypothetical protein [Paracoccaceae bacterium]